MTSNRLHFLPIDQPINQLIVLALITSRVPIPTSPQVFLRLEAAVLMWIAAVLLGDIPPTVRSMYSNSTARLPGSISVHTFNNTRPQQEAGGLFACVVYALSFPRLCAHTLEAEKDP